MMVVWNEQKTIQAAIESSMEFVDRYVVVDKNGETLPLIKKMEKENDLKIDYYVEPDMDRREARKFALSKLTEPWILIQDGDEVFHTSGPNSLLKLKDRMIHPHIYFRTRKNILLDDLYHTQKIQSGYHNFLYHNNGTLKIVEKVRKGIGDIPRMSGRGIYLDGIYIFNLHIGKGRREGKIKLDYDPQIQGDLPEVLVKRKNEFN